MEKGSISGIIIVGGGARGLFFAEILCRSLSRKITAFVENYKDGYDFIRINMERIGCSDVPIYATMEEAMQAIPLSDANTVFIMTPEWTHFTIFQKVVSSGYHVFLEKPIATKREDLLDIVSLASATDKVVQVGFVLRYSAFYKKVKELLEAGRIGTPVVIQMNERLSLQHGAKFKRSWHSRHEYTGGLMNEKCSHDLDLACWLNERWAKPVGVLSYGHRNFGQEDKGEENCSTCRRENCPWRDDIAFYGKQLDGKSFLDHTSPGIGRCMFRSDSDIHDHQTVLVDFDNGSQMNFTVVTMSGDPGRDIMIHGTEGVLEGNLEKGTIRVLNYWSREGWEEIGLDQLDSHGGGDESIVASFLLCIESGTRPDADVKSGARASLLALAADESIRRKCRIELD